MRKFELPYNFDKELILGYQLFGIDPNEIDCIYMPPFIKDYQSILRNNHEDTYTQLSHEEYIDHVNYINTQFPGKLQLLLQKTNSNNVMPEDIVKKYIQLGFKNFCVGSIEQARIIKTIDPSIKIVGSIAMHIDKNKIYENFKEYIQYFDSFVLDFSYNKNFPKIKQLPKYFEYILLANSRCNINCEGDRHWWGDGKSHNCPGIYPNIDHNKSCLIRPVDLYLFEPYINVFKLQDRGWSTQMILREVALYCNDLDFYMGPTVADSSIYQY